MKKGTAVPLKKYGRLIGVCSTFAVRLQHGFCHAAVGAAFHPRAMPVLKVFLVRHVEGKCFQVLGVRGKLNSI